VADGCASSGFFVASIGVKFYSGIGEHMAKPEIYQELPVRVAGEKILLFDDVADTGESLEFAGRHLEEFGASEITTATIFYKPHSKLEPDYYGSQTDAWIIFPCEVRETIEALSEKWQKAGVSPDEIKNRFLALNFREEWVDFYFKA
jgi:hypoxanthine phosphoribosyltransferase